MNKFSIELQNNINYELNKKKFSNWMQKRNKMNCQNK